MKYSNLYEIPTKQDNIVAFAGYNHNFRIADEEFYDMENLTSDYYPCLSPRGKRGVYSYSGGNPPVVTVPSGVKGVVAKDVLCWVEGSKFYVNGYGVEMELSSGEKQLVSMGAYVIIMPDKKWINTLDTTEHGNIDQSNAISAGTITYSMCKADGSELDTTPTVSSTEPVEPSDGDLWIDVSTSKYSMKQYSSTQAVWVVVATTYVKIAASGIANGLSLHDAVTINGIENSELADLNGQTSIIYGISDDQASVNDQFIVMTGIISATSTQSASTNNLSVARLMPAMDFVIEAGNRLWGCRYGTNNAGEVVNEIYASKQGDFKNWLCYNMGISTDSYVASVGTDGYFTGAITHLGYPIFFKENCLHKVYGSFPSNFQIQTTACRGVQKGAGKSLAIVNERLYYKGRNGVCVYDGSLPVEVAEAFGGVHYSGVDESQGSDPLRNGAVAGGHDDKYYISMRSERDNAWYFFVLDTALGTWHKEDNFRAVQFASCKGEIYAISASDGKLVTLLGSGTQDAESVKWYAETGVVGIMTRNSRGGMSLVPEKKYISRLVVRMSLALGAKARFYAEYDSAGGWQYLGNATGTNLGSFNISLKPRRCDHFRLRIEGEGEAKIYSIAKTIERGSDN